jgi:hypothetical protein
VSNSAWVCFACRLQVRRQTQFAGDVRCPECANACIAIGYKLRVPAKRDATGWRELAALVAAAKARRGDDTQRARVRERHDLEQEIRRLAALPANPGRERAIRDLRKRLAAYG